MKGEICMAKVSIVKWITNKIKQAMAIVQDGDTATRTISSGKYVLWNNNMYTANSNIASGDDLSLKLTACADGGLNELSANTTQAIENLQTAVSKCVVKQISVPLTSATHYTVTGIGIVRVYGGTNGTTFYVVTSTSQGDKTKAYSVAGGTAEQIPVTKDQVIYYDGGVWSSATLFCIDFE